MLPQKLDLAKMQTAWASQIDPIIANPLNKGIILKQVSLTAGSNTVNTLLGRALTGWSIVRQRAASSIYDTQDTNPTPSLTLQLVASAPVVVDIEVF